MDVTGAAVLDLAAARRLAAAASVPAPAVEAAWVCRGQPTAAALHALGEAAGLTGGESEARELAEACYAFARCVALRGGAEGAAEAAFPVGVAAPAELCAIARERGATWAVAAAARAPAPPRLLRARHTVAQALGARPPARRRNGTAAAATRSWQSRSAASSQAARRAAARRRRSSRRTTATRCSALTCVT